MRRTFALLTPYLSRRMHHTQSGIASLVFNALLILEEIASCRCESSQASDECRRLWIEGNARAPLLTFINVNKIVLTGVA